MLVSKDAKMGCININYMRININIALYAYSGAVAG